MNVFVDQDGLEKIVTIANLIRDVLEYVQNLGNVFVII